MRQLHSLWLPGWQGGAFPAGLRLPSLRWYLPVVRPQAGR